MWAFLDPEVIKKIESVPVLCAQCKGWETIRITKKCTTKKCDCGVTIYYPPDKRRDFAIKRFVSREEYLYNKGFLREIMKKDLESRGIVVKDAFNSKKSG